MDRREKPGQKFDPKAYRERIRKQKDIG